MKEFTENNFENGNMYCESDRYGNGNHYKFNGNGYGEMCYYGNFQGNGYGGGSFDFNSIDKALYLPSALFKFSRYPHAMIIIE